MKGLPLARPGLALLILFLCATKAHALTRQSAGRLIVEARSNNQPVERATVKVGTIERATNQAGEALFELPPGNVEVRVEREGFRPNVARQQIVENATARMVVELEPEEISESITVTATRSENRIEDEPLRVEVINQEELEEKALMTPGDIAMLLNETSGLRVQVTSPSLGAANVRVQGLRGRYTQLIADGLPLYGGQTGATGLLQIPPLDLGQVEVIKGVASSLYGASALGGVINLVSRRPQKSERELLLNATTRNGQDATFWYAEPPASSGGWGYTLLGGAHLQQRADVDDDNWANMPMYRRGDIRPRFFRDSGAGRSLFATLGVMAEERTGGTIGNATVASGQPFPEKLDTSRFDGGFVSRFLAGTHLVSFRGSGMTQRHRHQFGANIERDHHDTWFGEATISGERGAHHWLVGSAIQADLYRSRDVSRMDYSYVVPAVFVQDEYKFGRRVTLSGSGRLDMHNVYGAFLNPRISILVRLPRKLTARVSTGTGVFAPTPFTEETEAVGLSRVLPLVGIKTERAWSASGDIGWTGPHFEFNGTLFGSIVRNPVTLRPALTTNPGELEIANLNGPTRTIGTELLVRAHGGEFGFVVTHTFVQTTEIDRNLLERHFGPLTPRHSVGAVGTWEREGRWRVGTELFYTGRQRLDDNPYRDSSSPYWIFGVLIERHFGNLRIFLNGENLTNTRQTRYDPLLRSTPNFDGRWTVDAWAPLDGRVMNGGIRLKL